MDSDAVVCRSRQGRRFLPGVCAIRLAHFFREASNVRCVVTALAVEARL